MVMPRCNRSCLISSTVSTPSCKSEANKAADACPLRPVIQSRGDVIQTASPTGRDHRYRHRLGHSPCERQVITGLGAITIHRGEQDLTSAQLRHTTRPIHHIKTGVLPASLHEHIPAISALLTSPCIDRHHDALAAEAVGATRDKLWITHRRGIETDLVGSGPQQLCDPVYGRDPPPTVKGIVTSSAVRRTMSTNVALP